MADTPLPYPNRIVRASKGSLKFRAKKAAYGDNLKQITPDGLNAIIEKWSVSWRLSQAEYISLLTTIRDSGVWTIMSWTTPYEGLALRWTFSDSDEISWERVGTGGAQFEVTAVLEQYTGV